MPGARSCAHEERVHPVILCGGAGRRLWPLSRPGQAKPFLPLGAGGESLFRQTLRRLRGELFAPPLIVADDAQRFTLLNQLDDIRPAPQTILLEPVPRDTAAAVLAAALHLHAQDADALMLVCPADHVMANPRALLDAIRQAVPAARKGRLVALGVPPTRAETGYGYLELEQPLEPEQPLPSTSGMAQAAKTSAHASAQVMTLDPPARTSDVLAVRRFIEKPDAATAQRLLKGGRVLWNAGMFLFSARAVIEAFSTHAADLLPPVRAALAQARMLTRAGNAAGMLKLDAGSLAQARRISFDHAVMERAGNVCAVVLHTSWDDVGDWNAVWRMAGHDENGNALQGDALALDCQDCLLHAAGGQMQVVGLGLQELVIAATPHAVLVADRKRAQEVRTVAALLAQRERQSAHAHLPPCGVRVHRPWGWYECLARGPGFQVKRLLVKPHASLSLQSHRYRAEHWIVLSGRARATIGDEVVEVGVNESAFVPVGVRHRLANPHDAPLVVVEVQSGSYLGEDDIIRHDQPHGQPDDGTPCRIHDA